MIMFQCGWINWFGKMLAQNMVWRCPFVTVPKCENVLVLVNQTHFMWNDECTIVSEGKVLDFLHAIHRSAWDVFHTVFCCYHMSILPWSLHIFLLWIVCWVMNKKQKQIFRQFIALIKAYLWLKYVQKSTNMAIKFDIKSCQLCLCY